MATPKPKDEETTLDLDQAMAEGMEVYQGELEEAALEDDAITPTPGTDAGPPEDEAAQEAAAPADQADRDAKDKSVSEDQSGADEPPPADEPAAPDTDPKPKKTFRFKDHEAAEEGYRNLQGRTTKAEERIKELEEKLQAREAEEAARAKDEELDQKYTEYAAQRHQEALAAIEDLAPEDAEYQARVAKIWAEKDRDVRRYERDLLKDTPPPSPSQAAADAGGTPAGEDAGEATPSREDIMAYVGDKAKAAGIDPADEHFKLVCQQAPSQDEAGRDLTLDEQIQWVIEKTQGYYRKVSQRLQEEQAQAAQEKAEAQQDRGLPMGRSGAQRPAAPSPAGPVSLDDAVSDALNERRL